MKTYNVSVTQVSKGRPNAFSVLVNGKAIAEVTHKAPSFGSPYGAEARNNVIFEDAYQTARRVIIHSFNDDVDVFTQGSAKMDFGDYKIKWAE